MDKAERWAERVIFVRKVYRLSCSGSCGKRLMMINVYAIAGPHHHLDGGLFINATPGLKQRGPLGSGTVAFLGGLACVWLVVMARRRYLESSLFHRHQVTGHKCTVPDWQRYMLSLYQVLSRQAEYLAKLMYPLPSQRHQYRNLLLLAGLLLCLVAGCPPKCPDIDRPLPAAPAAWPGKELMRHSPPPHFQTQTSAAYPSSPSRRRPYHLRQPLSSSASASSSSSLFFLSTSASLIHVFPSQKTYPSSVFVAGNSSCSLFLSLFHTLQGRRLTDASVLCFCLFLAASPSPSP